VNFTAPANNFFLISLSDFAPAGWNVTVNTTWCTPVATSVTATGNETQIVWGGSFSNGTFFTAVYKVAVPEDAGEGFYTFTGFLRYYFGSGGPYAENIGGDSQVFFPPELQGQVGFYRAYPAPNVTWETPLVVSFFDNATGIEAGWSPKYVTTDAYGNFTIPDVAVGTYDIGIKNWTTLSKMVYGEVFTDGNTTVVNFTTLIEADCDNNDKAESTDYSKVLNNYGVRETTNATFWATYELWKADYTRDQKIDSSDYASVLNSYGKRGDIFYYTH